MSFVVLADTIPRPGGDDVQMRTSRTLLRGLHRTTHVPSHMVISILRGRLEVVLVTSLHVALERKASLPRSFVKRLALV